MSTNYQPNQENIITDNPNKIVYHFFNNEGKSIHKTKEIYKKQNRIIIYPYYYRRNGQLTKPKLKHVEFKGWENLVELPKDFNNKKRYGLLSARVKILMRQIKRRFPKVEKIIIGINEKTSFADKSITLSWDDINKLMIRVSKLQNISTQNRIEVLDQQLSKLTNKIPSYKRKLSNGKLSEFLETFDVIESINENDIMQITRILKHIPSTINATTHFIETREMLNIIYLEDLIEEYKKLLQSKVDNEEAWQRFFEKYSWVLTHVFPYEVILKGTKAFLGGTTYENRGGKLLDFLFSNGFKDNHALLEIKTHLKPLLKNKPYRNKDVFSLSDDLSGGISQSLDYKDWVVRNNEEGVKAYDPKCILVIGQKNLLQSNQRKSFELSRANQKNVEIITFDEILDKLEALHKILIKKV